MKTLRHLASILLVLLPIQPVTAGPWEDFGKTFGLFIQQLDGMQTTAKKEYTIDQLSRLHKDLFQLEKKQEYLILMLEKPGMIDNNLSSSIFALRKRANAARGKIKRIGKKVPSLSKQTNKLQKQLYRSTHSKKSWPSSIKKYDIPDYHLDHYLLTEGKNSLQITHDSRKALEKFLTTH